MAKQDGSSQLVVLAALSGAAAGAALHALVQALLARRAAAGAEALSTTSSGHSGSVYETDKAVAEYLMFHFGAPADILPYAAGPHAALDFASRTARLCVDWVGRQGLPLDAALDVGCAVGRTSFDLTPTFQRVVGLDFSHAFIAAANQLKATGSARYRMTVEGDVSSEHTAAVPPTAIVARATFIQGDACALPSQEQLAALGVPGGRFSVIHGANLLCRLPEPRDYLRRLPGLLVPGGLVVHVSPYSWLKQYTPRDKWIGAKVDAESGAAMRSAKELHALMAALGFELLHEEQVPFLIREHARKFQWGCSHATVYRLRA